MNKLWKTAAAPLALCLCAVLAFSACSSDSDGGGQAAGRFAGEWRMTSMAGQSVSGTNAVLRITDGGWTYSDTVQTVSGTCRFSGDQVVCVMTSNGYSADFFTLTLDASGGRLSGTMTTINVTFVRE